MEWVNLGNGIQYRKHKTRKHAARFDRYLRGRYTSGKKTVTLSFGWESIWIAAERARMQVEGDTGPRRSFLDYSQGELARFKLNAQRGEGPLTLKQDKALREAQTQAEAEAQAGAAREALTFGEYFVSDYLPAAKISKKENTCRQEESIFKTWLKPNIARFRLIDIRPLHIEKVKREMVKKEKAPRTMQLVLATARQIWNHARNNGVVSGDWPGRSVKAGRFDNRRLRFLSYDESENLLANLKETSQQVHDMTLLSLDTGMRAGEVFSLIWEHVKIEAGQIHVVDTKNGKNRTAYMTDRVRIMFERLPEGEGLVFPSNTGNVIGQISKTFQIAVDELGLNQGVVDTRNKVTYHSCRHTFASNLVATGTNLYEVMALMGHSTLALTERYSHVRNENLEAAVSRMEEARGKGQKSNVFPLKKSGNA